MNHARRPYIGIMLAAFVLIVMTPIAAQSQNSQALTWLKNGLAEKDPQKKIAAYRKAIELDSLFVEVQYNLGLTYRKQQDYRLAELWFYKAYLAKPHKTKPELRQQIALELARTYKRLDKLQACEEVLVGAKELTTDSKIRAEILFELGRCRFDQGRYDDALTALHEGENLDRGKAQNFKNFMQLVEGALESQRLTDSAQKALTSGDLTQGQIFVEQLRQKNPDSPNLKALTSALDSLSEMETNRRVLAAMYEQAQKEAIAGKLETAIVTYESLLQKAGDYKDAKEKLEAVRQQMEQKQIQVKLEEDYTAGLAAMRVRNWPLAILSFEKVLGVDQNFQEVNKLLEQAKRELETESTETIVARYYAEGLAAMNRDDLGGALAAFEKVRRLNRSYRDVADLLEAVDRKLRNKAQSALHATQVSLAQAETLYQEAALAIEKQEWMEAVVALEKLQLVQPGYRDVVDRLAEARANLTVAAAGGSGSNTWLYVGGAFCAFVLFPLAGFIVFSPGTRARLHLLRGNYIAAAQLYEKILQRRPGRVKLYSLLANIYLLMGRQDDQALKVYKAILQLNIATHKRDEINTIVAQNYLTEGRTDSDAIAVLESALKAERLKLNQGNY
ncbi:MAG: tetratricopeptide repeat protein [bacterium]